MQPDLKLKIEKSDLDVQLFIRALTKQNQSLRQKALAFENAAREHIHQSEQLKQCRPARPAVIERQILDILLSQPKPLKWLDVSEILGKVQSLVYDNVYLITCAGPSISECSERP